MPETIDDRIEVIAPNLKRRLSGVTATIVRLLPLLAQSIGIVATGPGLPAHVPCVPLRSVILMSGRAYRVWHARRNTEMLMGLILRHVLRKRLEAGVHLRLAEASYALHSPADLGYGRRRRYVTQIRVLSAPVVARDHARDRHRDVLPTHGTGALTGARSVCPKT